MNSATRPGFDQYAQQVYGWAYRVLGRHHDALDVVQDVFLKWDEQCGHEIPRQPRGWLRTVTLNHAVDVRRRAGASHDRIVQLAGVARPDRSDPTSLGEAMERDELRVKVHAALEPLTDLQRVVLVAKVYDTLSFREIAEDLDLSISTVKTHYLRALRAVRERLQPVINGEKL